MEITIKIMLRNKRQVLSKPCKKPLKLRNISSKLGKVSRIGGNNDTFVILKVSVFVAKPGLEVAKLYSCSNQLCMKFLLHINVKMPMIVGILTFISKIHATS